MNTKIATTALLTLLLVLVPATTMAYSSPEEFLISRDSYLPPSARDAWKRSEMQAEESAARRQREQERAFALQNPPVQQEPAEETLHGSAPQMQMQGGNVIYAIPVQQGVTGFPQLFGSAPLQTQTDTANLELARTMRLLSRVNQNQAAAQLSQVLHTGAPDLAPTGAGSVLAMLTILGAVGYTLWRVQKAQKAVRVL